MMRQREMDFGRCALSGGLALATFGSVICLLAILPFAVNQFAIDRAGLTMALLSPIGTASCSSARRWATASSSACPTLLCILIALLLFRDRHAGAVAEPVPLSLVDLRCSRRPRPPRCPRSFRAASI